MRGEEMERGHVQPRDGGWQSNDDERRREVWAHLRLVEAYQTEFHRLFGRSASPSDVDRAIEECESSEIELGWEG